MTSLDIVQGTYDDVSIYSDLLYLYFTCGQRMGAENSLTGSGKVVVSVENLCQWGRCLQGLHTIISYYTETTDIHTFQSTIYSSCYDKLI